MKKSLVILISIVLSFPKLFAQEPRGPVDENGKRHGIWSQYYPNSKQLRYTGEFVHGKEVGEFRFYCEDCKDKPNVIKVFNPDNDIADVKFFEKEKLIAEGKMDGKIHIGKWIYFHKNSKQIMTEEHYLNGKLEGQKITYFPTGKIAEIQHFKNGIKEGENNYYTKDGVLLKKMLYKNDQLDGPAVFFDPSGKKLAEGNYKAGIRHGTWRYYDNGKLTKEEKFPKRKKSD